MAKGPDWRGEQITAWPWVERGIEDRSYCPARLLEPRYCRVTDSVAPCNIQKSELNGQPIMAIELHDAVERRWLASYTQLTKERKEYLLNCELKPTSQKKETICKSKQEFDAFVSKYMEQ